MSSFILLYCADNQDIAQKFSYDLSTVGANFTHFVPDEKKSISDLRNYREPIIALVSDNFLKNENCIRNAFSTLQDLIKNGQMMTIVTEGKAYLPDGTAMHVPTQFERVSNVIKYMNHWQEEYLEARKKHHNHQISDQALNDTREISNQIGDIIRLFRESNYQYFENVVAKNYLTFCQMSGLPQPSVMSDYRSTAAPATVTPIATIIAAKEEGVAPITEIVATSDIADNQDITVAASDNLTTNEAVIPVIEEIVAVEKIDIIDEEEITAVEEAAAEIVTLSTENEIVIEEKIEEVIEVTDEKQTISTVITPTEDETIEELLANIPGIGLLQNREMLTRTTDESKAKEIEEDDFFEETKTTVSGSNINQILDEVLEEEDNEAEQEEKINLHDDDDEDEDMDLSLIYEDEEDEDEKDDAVLIPLENIFDEDAPSSNSDDDDFEDIISGNVEATPATDAFLEKLDPEIAAIQAENKANNEINHEIENTDNILESMKEEDASEVAMLDTMRNEINADPDNSRMRLRYAVALAQLQNNWQEASRQVTIVLEKEPHNADAYYLLGEMAEINRDAMMATNYFEKVATINPEYPNIHYKLAEINASFPNVDVKKTKKYFKNAIALDENNADLLYAYASFLDEKADKKEKAIKYYKKSLQLDAQHPFANYDIATAYFSLNEPYEANDFYQRAIAINPELKTVENDEVFTIKPILSADRAEEAINTGVTDNEVQQFDDLIDNSIASEMPNQSIETPTINEEIATAVNALPVLELEQSNQKTLPNPDNKIILITGATAGIGKATAELLAKEGFNLILTGRRADRLTAIADRFNEQYDGTTTTLVFDIQKYEETEKAIQSLDNQWCNVDVLLNNAGLGLGLSPIHEGDLAQWDTMIDTNIKGLLYMTRLIAPRMVENQSGHIINLCSTAGKEAYPNGNVYCATKFAVDALTKSMRIDLHKHNIRVSQVAPGAVEETEFSLVRFEGDAARADKVYENFQALRASDVAEVIHFIITRPSHVNIQDVLLMGTQQANASIIDRSGRA
jgi:NADP-dependent 3-hydroxy acid dehydrogenase YdfG/Tfp pilus assembly protein PilF